MIRTLLLLLLLSGCATPPSGSAVRPVQSEAAPFAMNGRILVKYDGSRDSAGLRWVHKTQSDEVLLLNPLGQTAVRVYRDEKQAVLDDGERHFQEADVEALMTHVLGWSLQLDELHHWALGKVADGPALIERDDLGRLRVLRQDGWEVRYLAYAEEKSDSLPRRMQLTRDNLQVTLLMDEWEWSVE
ncbi:MAG: lipoprotein insertase outer membrane protein LolB [Gallionella sp.]|nr:lipoprotein insertase outer membrane protein LolB [Gallionella sp.]MDD4945895.1 lipoprotein insertase outer membrane protein LolB [Gallionella sp.]MDD5611830.1 lipoprotein insertase outer membrane protein LolB [Gallionella sp.]